MNWFSGNEASGSALPQVGIQDSVIDSEASGVYLIFIFSSNYESCDFCVSCFSWLFWICVLGNESHKMINRIVSWIQNMMVCI